MICSKCGYVSSDSDLFCIKCGTPLRKPEAEPEAVNEADDFEPVTEPEAVEEDVFVPEPVQETVSEEIEEIENNSEVPAEEVRDIPETVSADEEVSSAEPEAEESAEEAPVPDYFSRPVYNPVIGEETVKASPSAKPENKPAPVTNSRLNKPLSVWGYLWRTVLFCIPVLNIIPLFVFAFSSNVNKNSKNYASAVLILMLIGLIIAVTLVFLIITYTDHDMIQRVINQYTNYFVK